jgi:hypothetical protein
MDYQVMLKGMELKRDIEAILTGANQAKVTGNSSTAPKLADVLAWIKTNTVKGGGTGADPTAADGTSARVDSATQRAFVENDLKSALKKAYDSGGRPNKILMGSFNKQAFSMFTGRGTTDPGRADKAIVRRLTCTCRTSASSLPFPTCSCVPVTFWCSRWTSGLMRRCPAVTSCPTIWRRPATPTPARFSHSTRWRAATKRHRRASSISPARKSLHHQPYGGPSGPPFSLEALNGSSYRSSPG